MTGADAPGPLPVTVIGGFLGAGKTTLLNHWLALAGGERLAVLVNDFGEIVVDAALVRSRSADTVALANGCVCCSIGDDLGAALDRVLADPVPFDAVVVEASGVADPWRVAQYAIADPRLRLHAVLAVVDAGALAQQAGDPLLADTLARGVAHADLVLLNKADLAGEAARAQARRWLNRHAPASPVLDTVQSAVPRRALDEAHYRPRPSPQRPGPVTLAAAAAAVAAADHDARFEAWSCRPGGRYDGERLRAWAASVAPQVLRLKAVLALADGGRGVLQLAGRRATLRRIAAADATARPDAATGAGAGGTGAEAATDAGPVLAAVGLRGSLDRAALAAGLAACAVHNEAGSATREPPR